MRYLPHSAAERADMLAVIGARHTRTLLFSAVPAGALISEPLDLPPHSPEFLVEAHMRALAGKNRAGRRWSVLRRGRGLPPPRPRDRRSPDPAQRVAHGLHALPARGLAGHAADALRVPDPGGKAHRHGGRQRLDVRRLDRDRRGRADGAPPDPPQPRRPQLRPPPALSRRRPLLCRRRPRSRRRAARVSPARCRWRSTTTPPPSSSRRPISTARSATSRSSRCSPTTPARC